MTSSDFPAIADSLEEFQKRSATILENLQIVSESISYEPHISSALAKMIEDLKDMMGQIKSIIETFVEDGSEYARLLTAVGERKNALSSYEIRLQEQGESLQNDEKELLDGRKLTLIQMPSFRLVRPMQPFKPVFVLCLVSVCSICPIGVLERERRPTLVEGDLVGFVLLAHQCQSKAEVVRSV